MAAMAMQRAVEAMTDMATSIGRPSSVVAHRLAEAIGVSIGDNVTAFLSGMNRPGDIAKALEAGKPFGVEVNELSGNAIKQIAKGVGEKGGSVFVDSGAFTLFTATMRGKARNGRHTTAIDLEPYGFAAGTTGEAMDFKAVLSRYEELVSGMQSAAEDAGFDDADDPAHAKVMLVMPDVVGDQSESIALVAGYAGLIRGWQGMKSVRPIIPIQRGDATLAEAYDAIVKLVGDDFIVGIPSSEEAVSNDELEQFIKARGDRIEAIHILGAASGKRLDPKIAIIRRFTGNRIEITADANMLRSSLYGSTGRDAAMSKALSQSGKRAVTDRTLADYGAQTSLFDSMNSSDDQMTAFPLQKTMAAVIAVANAPERLHRTYGYDAVSMADAIGIGREKLMKIGTATKPVTTTHESVVSPLEYPSKEAEASYSGISHSGRGRAEMDRNGYLETVQRLYDEAIEQSETEAQRAAVLDAIDKFKREYLQREGQVISVRSGTYSGYVAGRSKLNSRQANAGNDRLSKAQDDFYNWLKRASPSIMQAVRDARSPEQIEAERQAAEDKRIAKERQFDDVMVRLLNFRSGDDFMLGKYRVLKVGKARDGRPRDVTFAPGQGLMNDRMQLVGTKAIWPTEEALKASYDRAMASGHVVDREAAPRAKTAAKPVETPPPGALTMTMDEWKKIHRDFKSVIDGKRMTIRNGVLQPVYIVKADATPSSQTYYHGSDAAAPASGGFTYLTPEKAVASTYGKNVMAVNVSVSKTLDMTNMKTARKVFDDVFPDIEDEELSPVGVMIAVRYGEDEIKAWAQSNGYDSILLPTTKSMDIMELADKPALVVFDPAKIKKAQVSGFDSIDAAAHEAATSPRNYLSTILEAITGFDGDGKKAIQLAGMLGIRPSSLSAGGPLDDDLWNYKSDEYFHSARMSDYKAKLKDEGRSKSGYLISNGYQVTPDGEAFVLRPSRNPFRMVEKTTRKPFEFDSEQDAADFAKRLPHGSKVQGPLIDSPDDVPTHNEQLVADAPGGDVDLFGEPILPPEDMGGDLFGDEPAPQHMPIEEIPVHEIGLSADVPQFKSGADDETGVVEPLGGKFDRTGVAPIQLWKRRDGRYEVISGRHRLDLARRSGEKTIPSQVHYEDRGFDARRAAMLDAELNIRDGQGKVRDYIDYFTHSGITEADAEAKGLIARHIGQRAFAIATQGSEDLISAHKAEIISDQAAADIAGLAPGNAAMQAVGIRAIQEGKPIQTAVNTMRAVMALARESGQAPDTMDLFGFDDSALREAEAMAKLASRKQRQVGEQLAAIKGAAKRPELARKQGVAVDDPDAVRNRVIELTALKQRWDNWSSHSDLLAEIRAEISKPGFDSLNADDHEIPDDGYWFWMESLAA